MFLQTLIYNFKEPCLRGKQSKCSKELTLSKNIKFFGVVAKLLNKNGNNVWQSIFDQLL